VGQLTIIEAVQNKEKHNTTRADAARRVVLIGTIVISRRPGRFTTFHMILPTSRQSSNSTSQDYSLYF
jgi:hypothetical protein